MEMPTIRKMVRLRRQNGEKGLINVSYDNITCFHYRIGYIYIFEIATKLENWMQIIFKSKL